MNDITTIARFSLNGSSTKEKIIHLLAEKFPLHSKEVHAKLMTDYSTGVTYQAVHKLLQELESEKKTEKGWKLKKEWILEGHEFFKNTLEKHAGTLNRYDIPKNFEGTLTFEFDSFTDYPVKTAELLASKQLAKDGDGYFICVLEYAYWSFKFRFEHLQLLLSVTKNCPGCKIIVRKDNPFGRWVVEQYKRINAICAPIGAKVEIDEELFVQGDYIIETKISEDGKKTLEHYWNKWKNINDLFLDFSLKEDPKICSTVKITKNPRLAEFLRKELQKYFEGT